MVSGGVAGFVKKPALSAFKPAWKGIKQGLNAVDDWSTRTFVDATNRLVPFAPAIANGISDPKTQQAIVDGVSSYYPTGTPTPNLSGVIGGGLGSRNEIKQLAKDTNDVLQKTTDAIKNTKVEFQWYKE